MARVTPAIIPQLPYADVRAALDWLERAFGFREAPGVRFVGANGAIHTEVVSERGGHVMLGSPGGHGVFPPAASGRPSMLLSVYVDDADAHCVRARGAGAQIVAEPEDMFFGDRVYECVDPEGHRWRFHQQLR
jgi:uncharacterized glyoxalase superfamily protein PhnB